jgi:hypothetical protein
MSLPQSRFVDVSALSSSFARRVFAPRRLRSADNITSADKIGRTEMDGAGAAALPSGVSIAREFGPSSRMERAGSALRRAPGLVSDAIILTIASPIFAIWFLQRWFRNRYR